MKQPTEAPLLRAQTSFAVNLLNEVIKNNPEATACSPFSASVSLAMVYAGARGETKKEIKDLIVGKSEVTETQVHSYFSELLRSVFNKTNSKERTFCLESANKLFIREGFELKEAYEQTIAEYYAGMLEQTDFKNKAALCKEVNGWVKETTHGLIKKILSKEDINKDTPMIILNALYFKAKWAEEFDKKLTKMDEFRMSGDETREIELMNIKKIFAYYENDDVQVLCMRYKCCNFSNFVFLPKRLKDIKSLLDGFDGKATLDLIKKTEKSQYSVEATVTVKIPKFEVNVDIDLEPVLNTLGMQRAFQVANAEFEGISDQKPFFIDKATQSVCIKMNEKGTEAAAATKVAPMTGSSGVLKKSIDVEFIADHPFFYFIVHNFTTSILFAGAYT